MKKYIYYNTINNNKQRITNVFSEFKNTLITNILNIKYIIFFNYLDLILLKAVNYFLKMIHLEMN